MTYEVHVTISGGLDEDFIDEKLAGAADRILVIDRRARLVRVLLKGRRKLRCRLLGHRWSALCIHQCCKHCDRCDKATANPDCPIVKKLLEQIGHLRKAIEAQNGETT